MDTRGVNESFEEKEEEEKHILLVAAAPRDVTLDPTFKSDVEIKLKAKTCSHLGQLVVPTRATLFAQKHAVMHSFSCSFEMKARIQRPQSPPPKWCIPRQGSDFCPSFKSRLSGALQQSFQHHNSHTKVAHHSILKTTWSQESHLSSKPVLGSIPARGKWVLWLLCWVLLIFIGVSWGSYRYFFPSILVVLPGASRPLCLDSSPLYIP